LEGIKMEIKNEVFEMGIIEALKKVQDTDMPIKEGFKVLKLINEMQKASEDYFKAKDILLSKYGTPSDEKEGMIKFEGDNLNKFQDEFKSLIDISFNIEFEKINLPENVLLKPRELRVLENIIELKNA
jgi:hypothetical protein